MIPTDIYIHHQIYSQYTTTTQFKIGWIKIKIPDHSYEIAKELLQIYYDIPKKKKQLRIAAMKCKDLVTHVFHHGRIVGRVEDEGSDQVRHGEN